MDYTKYSSLITYEEVVVVVSDWTLISSSFELPVTQSNVSFLSSTISIVFLSKIKLE